MSEPRDKRETGNKEREREMTAVNMSRHEGVVRGGVRE